MTATGEADAASIRSLTAGAGGFRAWRRSRPLWGGLLMLLAGLELLAIPLSGVLIQGQVKLVIYIGIGGVFGVLIGALLAIAGIAVWVNPAHRVFYGIAGIILGILSFPASNLGGFFIGMLLAILGGALSFAWSPVESGPGPRCDRGRDNGPGPGNRRVHLPTMLDDGPPRESRRLSGGFGADGSGSGGSGFGRPGGRMLAAGGILPCILFCSMTASPSSTSSWSSSARSATASSSPSASAGKEGSLPSAVQSAGNASKNALGQVAKSAAAVGKSGKSGQAGQKNTAKRSVPVNQVQSPSALVAPSTRSELTAKSSTLAKLNLVGVTTLPVGGGGSEKALEFTASSASLSLVGITIHQSGHMVLTKTASLSMPSGMTLYTTKLCGQVEGIAPNLCFTPDTASQVALKLASVLGKAMPITMTNVTADQFLDVAGTAEWGPLTMSAG